MDKADIALALSAVAAVMSIVAVWACRTMAMSVLDLLGETEQSERPKDEESWRNQTM